MSNKPKILWSADIVARTGFARVTENLIVRLKDQFDIVVLGNNWWGDANPFQKDFKMYPSSNRFQTEPFGVQRIREVVEKEKPDLVFVNNDLWIINQIYSYRSRTTTGRDALSSLATSLWIPIHGLAASLTSPTSGTTSSVTPTLVPTNATLLVSPSLSL